MLMPSNPLRQQQQRQQHKHRAGRTGGRASAPDSGSLSAPIMPSNVSHRVALLTTVRPRYTRPSASRTPTARAASPSPSITISCGGE